MFATSNDSKRVFSYRVNISKPVKDLLIEFKDFLTVTTEQRRVASSGSSLNVLSSKVHKKTLRSRLGLVMDKAKRDAVGKSLTNWELAIFSGLVSTKLNGLAVGMKLSAKNEPARIYAGMWVSRLIKEAGCISENAARGAFPSLAKTPAMLELDFLKIDWYARTESMKFFGVLRAKRSQSKLPAKAFYRKQLPADIRKQLNLNEMVAKKVEVEVRKIERVRRDLGDW